MTWVRRRVWLGPTRFFSTRTAQRAPRGNTGRRELYVVRAQYVQSALIMQLAMTKGLECGAVSHPKKEGVSI